MVKNSTSPATSTANPATGTPSAAAVANRKERSVLQAKLTKLAIQIGYAGQCRRAFPTISLHVLALA